MDSMQRMEEDLLDDTFYPEAEGAAEAWDEDDWDAYDEDAYDMGDEMDEWDAAGDYVDDYESADEMDAYDDYDEALGFDEYDDADDAFDSAIAYALEAEDTDEFFGRLIRGIRRIAPKVMSGLRRAGSVVGRVARVAAPIARMIPHPYAQAAATGLGLLSNLRAEGASEEEALEAFAELASYDEAAIPIVSGLAARSVLKRKGAHLPAGARKQVARTMTRAARTLVARRGPKAIRALPRIVASVKRSGAAKRAPVRALPKVVNRTVLRVVRSKPLVRKLSRPIPRAVRKVRILAGPRAGGRSFVVRGPVRISISPA